MSNLKRFLAMTLVMLTMISAIATTVSAKTFEDVQVLKNAELTAAIDILSELGIVKGVSEGNFDPDTPVTRQQMALFIARIHSATPEYFVASSAEKDKPNFKDVSDPTYFTAINYCFEHQIINGRVAPSEEGAKNGEFDPTGTII